MDRNEMTKRLNSAWAWAKKPVVGMPRWGWAVLAIAIVGVIIWRWEGIRHELSKENLSNFTVILGAIIGILLASWRSTTAHKQAETAQRGLQNERYQKGIDMLGSESLATRIGGIYSLGYLAQEHPEEYHIQIMDSLCAFVRLTELKENDTEDVAHNPQSQENVTNPDPDVQAVLTVIKRRNQEQLELEEKKGRKIDLSESNLEGADLADADLMGAKLIGINLENASLMGVHLTGAELWHARLMCASLIYSDLEVADLTGAHLTGADLTGADLTEANLTRVCLKAAEMKDTVLQDAVLKNAHLEGVKGLTQEMLDRAAHFDDNGKPLPGPNLEEAYCDNSGRLLEWFKTSDSSSTSNNDEPDSSSS